MSGSKMTTQRKEILAAVKKVPPGGDYAWDGKDEDDRPLTREEMQKGVAAYRKKRGRPISAVRKEQVSVRYSPEVLAYFRATGEGWQTRMDAALQVLVRKHPDWLKKLG
ncbi:MAG: BrnA antitoxin family protein [Giesbergeria sp.]